MTDSATAVLHGPAGNRTGMRQLEANSPVTRKDTGVAADNPSGALVSASPPPSVCPVRTIQRLGLRVRASRRGGLKWVCDVHLKPPDWVTHAARRTLATLKFISQLILCAHGRAYSILKS
jgi:hypothetical protein